jgi:hypothetical protein
MSDTKTVYRFDENGYFRGECKAQIFNDEVLLPPDCTETKPTLKNGYWSKWNGKKWENEKIPTTCAEAIENNLTCISNSPNAHDLEVKAILGALVASDSENYKIVVSDSFVMSIEEIPEPTPEEQQQKEDEDKQRALDVAIDNLIKEMAKADLMGDDDWKAELREQYNTLMKEEEQ